MFNLVIILLSTINSEPKDSNNYKIAKFLIENIRNLEDFSISELAKACYVSNSSVSRFCREIGLNDFNSLKTQIAKIPLEYQHAHHKFDFKSFDEQSLSKSYTLSVIDNLNMLYSTELDKQIKELVIDIYQYKHVAAFGYMHSQNVALNMQYDLQTSEKMIFTRIKFADQIDYISHSHEDTLIIIFSDTGTYFNRVFSRTIPFKNNKSKPKIVMITSADNLNIPYVDKYICYKRRKDYSSHPYALTMIADMICIEYSNYIQQKNT